MALRALKQRKYEERVIKCPCSEKPTQQKRRITERKKRIPIWTMLQEFTLTTR